MKRKIEIFLLSYKLLLLRNNLNQKLDKIVAIDEDSKKSKFI